MNLHDLGYSSYFEQHAESMSIQRDDIGRVAAVDRGRFIIWNEHGEIPSELTGKFNFGIRSSEDIPTVGDCVSLQYHDNRHAARITHVLPRRTFLRRKCVGKDTEHQMIAANIDVAFIMQSCHFDFNVKRLDRYLIMVNDGHIEPVILLTKTDLVAPGAVEACIASIRQSGMSARVIAVSTVTGSGLDEFRGLLAPGMTYCLIGSSGVGKTTLINTLLGEDRYDTKAVSGTGEGVHTTTRRELVRLEGAMLIDTPGMRELGLVGAHEGLGETFDDIGALAAECRFTDCSHTAEPGCAVRKALTEGTLSEMHYESFMKLRKESEYHEMSHAEKREKDKAFGRFINNAKKDIGKKKRL